MDRKHDKAINNGEIDGILQRIFEHRRVSIQAVRFAGQRLGVLSGKGVCCGR